MTEDTTERLTRCFQVVFPSLTAMEAMGARQERIAAWDSVAQVTLLAVVEEEFDLTLSQDGMDVVDSFDGMLAALRAALRDS
jgi:hypothetical protein